METIWKHKIQEGWNFLMLHKDCQILSVINQDDSMFIYEKFDTSKPDNVQKVALSVIGTGVNIQGDINDHEFLGTVVLNNGLYVFHVFYKFIGNGELCIN